MTTSPAKDLASYINANVGGVQAFDPTTINGRTEGVLVEQEPSTEVDVLLNTEKCRLSVTVRERGMGVRGTARAYGDACRIFLRLRLLQDTDIGGTRYDIITAETAPYEVYGGADESIWKFTVSAEREIEGLEWQ